MAAEEIEMVIEIDVTDEIAIFGVSGALQAAVIVRSAALSRQCTSLCFSRTPAIANHAIAISAAKHLAFRLTQEWI